mgnify:CR=1 FL=1
MGINCFLGERKNKASLTCDDWVACAFQCQDNYFKDLKHTHVCTHICVPTHLHWSFLRFSRFEVAFMSYGKQEEICHYTITFWHFNSKLSA